MKIKKIYNGEIKSTEGQMILPKHKNTPPSTQDRLRGKQIVRAKIATRKEIVNREAAQQEFNDNAFKCALLDMVTNGHQEAVAYIIGLLED